MFYAVTALPRAAFTVVVSQLHFVKFCWDRLEVRIFLNNGQFVHANIVFNGLSITYHRTVQALKKVLNSKEEMEIDEKSSIIQKTNCSEILM